MEDDRSSNENLAIIEQDYDYENELTTKPMKKMTKLDKSKSIETSTDIHRSDEFITKSQQEAPKASKQLYLATTRLKAQLACSKDDLLQIVGLVVVRAKSVANNTSKIYGISSMPRNLLINWRKVLYSRSFPPKVIADRVIYTLFDTKSVVDIIFKDAQDQLTFKSIKLISTIGKQKKTILEGIDSLHRPITMSVMLARNKTVSEPDVSNPAREQSECSYGAVHNSGGKRNTSGGCSQESLFNNYLHRTVKLDFPRFNGTEDPISWVCRAEQFF
ncbi:hypothetical protein WN943_001471 [Citrus x changshan-huyou]